VATRNQAKRNYLKAQKNVSMAWRASGKDIRTKPQLDPKLDQEGSRQNVYRQFCRRDNLPGNFFKKGKFCSW
jgi:hypothetical protein